MNRLSAVLICAALLLFATGGLSAAEGEWEFFEINAQYRGGMKKGFENLGCALAFFVDLQDGRRQVLFHSCVRHPEKKNSFYAFRLNLVMSSTGAVVKTDSEVYAWFDGLETEQQDQVKDMVLLLALIRDGSVEKLPKDAVQINRTVVKVECKKTGRVSQEYLINRPGKPALEAKFFLEADPSGRAKLDKFRFKREKIAVSFVSVPAEQIQAKYKTLAPYSDIVFGKGLTK